MRNLLLPARRELIGGERLLLSMPDGDRLAARLDRPSSPSRRPLIVLVHGLTGTETSINIVNTARQLVREGWSVLRINLRGSAVSRPTSTGRYHAGLTDDLAEALRQLPEALLSQNIVLVGHSLGGNLVLKFIGEGWRDLPVVGAVAVSTPIDLAAASIQIQAPRNILYHRHLLSALKREAIAPNAAITGEQRATIAAVRSICEFDDRFVAPCFGYRDAEDYYEQNSARHFLQSVDRPALVVHAMDDPWIPAASYAVIDWTRLSNVETAFSPRGGHLGFHGAGSRIGWHDLATAAWLERKFGAG